MSAIAPFPHRYEVTLEGGMLHAGPRAPIALGPPPQFGGEDDRVWSPEDLLLGAVLECLWTTFAAYARKDALEVRSWSGGAVGTLEKAPGAPAFTSIVLTVEMTVPAGDEERARKLLATAEDRCIISRALRAPISVDARIHAG